jgi:uncharacterized protein
MQYIPHKERIISIDVLRGIAVLGILLMNIQNFSMVGAAYLNPTAYGDLTGINKWIWIISHILADSKFISIFSILFGAGILIFTERAKANGRKGGQLHYWRNFILLIFGLIHAYFIWSGDILFTYALCGFFVFLFRKKTPKTLITLSIVFFAIPILFYVMTGLSIPKWPQEAYEENLQVWQPDQNSISTEIFQVTGSWVEQFKLRAETSIFMQSFLFFYFMFWKVTSMMLLGMALLKLKILSAERSNSFYKNLAIIGLIIGYAIIITGIYKNFEYNWIMEYSMFFGNQFNYIGSIGVALGYISIIMLICKSNGFEAFKSAMAKVGKMAFSNYILMSIFSLLIFSGSGLSLFGKVERWHQLLITIGIWVILIIFSNLWLKSHKLGPLEWFWRKLTYFKKK